MIKTCPVCGRNFETTSGARIYCSNACRFAGTTEPDGKGTMGECPVCKKTFRRNVRKQIYCGKSCAGKGKSQKYWANKKTKEPEPEQERYCEICGRSLSGIKAAKRYCDNPECRREGNRRTKALVLENRELVCACCGKQFKRANPVMYCSKNCRLADAARRRKGLEEQIRGTPVRLKVLQRIDVYDSMRPEVGKIYDGLLYKSISWAADTLVIPEIGKLGLVVRKDEVEIVE